MDLLLIIVVLETNFEGDLPVEPDIDDNLPDEPDLDDDFPWEDGSRFGVTEGLFLIAGHVILAEDLDGVDNFLPVMVCEALEELAIGEKLGAGFASRSRIRFNLGLELAPSDPVLFLFAIFVDFLRVQKYLLFSAVLLSLAHWKALPEVLFDKRFLALFANFCFWIYCIRIISY